MSSIDDLLVKDLKLPFKFSTQSKEGEVEACIYELSEEEAQFLPVDPDKTPFMIVCGKLKYTNFVDGSRTIGDTRKAIMEYSPPLYF